MELQHWCAR